MYKYKRCQVFGDRWNGKVDVKYNDGTEAVLTISQQRSATRIDVNAPVITPDYTATVIREQPQNTAA